MKKALNGLVSFGVTLLVLCGILAIFFDWDIVAAWNWFWSAVGSLFRWVTEFLLGSEIFRDIFG